MSIFSRKSRKLRERNQRVGQQVSQQIGQQSRPQSRQRVNANGDAAPSTRTKIRRFLYKVKHDLISFDGIAFSVTIVLTLAWTWGAISSLSRNWQLAQTVESRSRELAVLRLEVENSELENEYYKSAEYQELAARIKQNKLLEGEALVYLPDNSEAAKTKHQQNSTVAEAADDTATPSNFSQWVSFLFGA